MTVYSTARRRYRVEELHGTDWQEVVTVSSLCEARIELCVANDYNMGRLPLRIVNVDTHKVMAAALGGEG